MLGASDQAQIGVANGCRRCGADAAGGVDVVIVTPLASNDCKPLLDLAGL